MGRPLFDSAFVASSSTTQPKGRTIELAPGKRASHVGTGFIEGDIENTHLSRRDILRITNSYQH
jgi:hypothetical protein